MEEKKEKNSTEKIGAHLMNAIALLKALKEVKQEEIKKIDEFIASVVFDFDGEKREEEKKDIKGNPYKPTSTTRTASETDALIDAIREVSKTRPAGKSTAMKAFLKREPLKMPTPATIPPGLKAVAERYSSVLSAGLAGRAISNTGTSPTPLGETSKPAETDESAGKVWCAVCGEFHETEEHED